MSASTVSVTANTTFTGGRAVEQPTAGLDLAADSRNPPPNTVSGDLGTDQRPAISRRSSRVEDPRWLTMISFFTKNYQLLSLLVWLLSLLLSPFVPIILREILNLGGDSDGFSAMSGDVDGKFAEMDKFLMKSFNAMQVQVEAIDRKYEKGISSIKKEFEEKLGNQGKEVHLKLKELNGRSDIFEKFMGKFESKSLLSKEEFSDFFEEFRKSNKNGAGLSDEVTLDEIMDYARSILEKEIQRHEIQRHAADGLGMVDYALASGGGMVVRHSEPYMKVTRSGSWLTNQNTVHVDAEKMLRPGFVEPGQCFPLKGSSGFVHIRLRTAIVPKAVTLEHVAKKGTLTNIFTFYLQWSAAYDRSSAPRQCRVYGWLQGKGLTNPVIDTGKMFPLTEFTYDLDKSIAQTFNVLDSEASPIVDTIRLDFKSNHGSASHTCIIYRLRVHGHEPNSF